MQRPKNILVPTDLSFEADQALGHAIHFARLFGADVHLLHAVDDSVDGPASTAEMESIHAGMGEAAARRLDLAAQKDDERKIMLHTRLMHGFNVVPAVLTYVERAAIDLIVMGTRGRDTRERPMWQSHAEEIARVADCPVLTVGRGNMVYPGAPGRILVPVSFKTDAGPALRMARAVARMQRSVLELLHVATPGMGTADTILEAVAGRGRREEKLRSRLEQVFRDAGGTNVKHRLHIRYGDPAREVVGFAKRNRVNLIVVSSRGATGIRYAMEGSTTATMVGTATCPVLTLKTSDAGAAAPLRGNVAVGVHR